MDDRTAERANPDIAGRPTLIRGESQLFFPGMGRLSENSVVSIKNKSFSVTAEVVVPDSGAEGVIIALRGRFGGWAVYAKNGKAKFVGVGLIGTVSATVAAWFVRRHSEPVTKTADVASVDTEPAAATTADTQPCCWTASTNLPPSRTRFAPC
jgi:hypothetical protein